MTRKEGKLSNPPTERARPDLHRSVGPVQLATQVQVGADGTVRLAGYAPSAPQVLARLSRLPELRDPRFEGPVTREVTTGNRALDRFAIVATREDRP